MKMLNTVEGIVTKVDHNVLFIELEGGIQTIYFWKIYLANHGSIQLPKVGTRLKTYVSGHWFDAVYLMLEPNSVLVGEFELSDYPNRLLELFKDRQYSDNDLIISMKIHEKLRHWLSPPSKLVETHHLLYEILANRNYNIKLLAEFEFVYPFSNFQNFYKKLPFYSYETHWFFKSNEQNQVIIGYLSTNSKTGLTELTDFRRSIRCLLTNQIDIRSLLNQFVLISECVFFVEIFNGEKRLYFSEYILVDAKSIQVLQSGPAVTSSCEQKAHFVFTLLSKGLPFICNNSVTINATIRHDKSEKQISLKASKNPYDTILINSDYIIYGHTSPSNVSWLTEELKLLRINLESPEKSAEDVKLLLGSCSSSIISFQGKIESKYFFNDDFHIRKSLEIEGFGTPGNKRHVLDIYTTSGSFKVYLNDFEQCPTPLGLIPNMVVNFRNVAFSKNYFKFTRRSSFEVVEYLAPFKFQSANFLTDEPIIYPLCGENGFRIPENMNIWTSFNDFFLSGGEFQIHNIRKISMTIIGKQAPDECKVICNNQAAENLFWLLLGCNNRSDLKDKFCTVTQRFSFKPNNSNKNNIENCVIAEITSLLSRCSARINEEHNMLYLMCRRMFSKNSPNPVFILVDSRMKYDDCDDY